MEFKWKRAERNLQMKTGFKSIRGNGASKVNGNDAESERGKTFVRLK